MATALDNHCFRLVVPSQTGYLNLVTNLSKNAALSVGLDETASAKVSIAVDEAVTNIIRHAYNNDPNQTIEVDLRFLPGSLEISLWHSGCGLCQEQISLPDPKEYVKHPRKGGLGLLLMSRFMDEVRFVESEGRSQCCMIKHLR